MSTATIYHLAPKSEIQAGVHDGVYQPARFEEDGFVHCAAGRETVIAVARDYYAQVREPVMVLEIDANRLSASWRFEAAAPIDGGGTAHLETAQEFPHIYGAVNVDAISGIAILGPGDGSFEWPSEFAEFLSLVTSWYPQNR